LFPMGGCLIHVVTILVVTINVKRNVGGCRDGEFWAAGSAEKDGWVTGPSLRFFGDPGRIASE
jgi:hypothetical protein